MTLQQILSIGQVVIGILLGTAILLQQKGTGLSSAFGGEGGFYRTKRGFEKLLFGATIAFACLFLMIGIARIALDKNQANINTSLKTQTRPSAPVKTLPGGVNSETVPVSSPDAE